MADLIRLPGQRSRLVDGNGIATPEYYRWFERLVSQSTVTQITKIVEQIQNNPPGQATLSTIDGIVSVGSLPSGFMQISLETITQVSGGTIQTITIDGHGRIIESREATTDDLPEGTVNFWYLPSRIHNDDASIVVRIDDKDVYLSVGIIDCGVIPPAAQGRITSTGDRRVTSTADHRVTA